MKTFLFLITLFFAVSACSGPAVQETPRVYPTLHVEIDNSTSPLVSSDQEFARLVAKRVATKIADLPPGHKVSVRTFGDVNGRNNLRYDRQITRKSNPADKVARDVARLIDRNASSTTERQGSTEIIFTLTNGEYDCAAGDEILLLSDAIPSGQVRSASDVVNGRESLPESDAGLLDGCALTIWTLGRTKEAALGSAQIDTLNQAWASWSAKAGAKYSALVNP